MWSGWQPLLIQNPTHNNRVPGGMEGYTCRKSEKLNVRWLLSTEAQPIKLFLPYIIIKVFLTIQTKGLENVQQFKKRLLLIGNRALCTFTWELGKPRTPPTSAANFALLWKQWVLCLRERVMAKVGYMLFIPLSHEFSPAGNDSSLHANPWGSSSPFQLFSNRYGHSAHD